MIHSAVTPGLRLMAASSPPGLKPFGRSASSRLRFGNFIKGHACTANSAHSRWQGGSAVLRLIAHIGPITKHMNLPSGSPHSQHNFLLMHLPGQPGLMTRKS